MVLLKELVEQAKEKYGYYSHPQHKTLKPGYRQNLTGFYRVQKQKIRTGKGYTFQYKIVENGKMTRFTRQNLLSLKHETLHRGLPWEVSNELVARKLVSDEGLDWSDFE